MDEGGIWIFYQLELDIEMVMSKDPPPQSPSQEGVGRAGNLPGILVSSELAKNPPPQTPSQEVVCVEK